MKMKNQKAISMISLLVTIILIVVIASISSYYIVQVIEDVQYKDALEEMRNVKTVIEYAKTQLLLDQFSPDRDFLVTDAELENYFGDVLSEEQKEQIRTVNNSDADDSEKYYLLNRERFEKQFENGYTIMDIRENSVYLVNYMDVTIYSNSNSTLITNESAKLTPDLERGQLFVAFSPNGSREWKKEQETQITILGKNAVEITKASYAWSQSYTEPEPSAFQTTFQDGETISLQEETGKDWYLWIKLEYLEQGQEKVYITKSNPFYMDNLPPTGTLVVEEA